MPQEIQDDAPDALFEEATLWLARLREPGAAAGDRAAFDRWRAADPRHQAAYDQAARLWSALAAPAAELARQAPSAVTARPRPPRRFFARRRLAAAAMAAMLALGIWLGRGGFDDLRSDYVTSVGARQAVALGDGSELLLNTDTAIAVDLDAEARRVRLYRGEAYFRVAKDAARPFVIETPDGEIRVTGTAFNLRALDGRTVVSVVEGQVEVTAPPAAPARLGPGQQIATTADGLQAATGFDATVVTAWQRGQVVFYRTPLGEVVDELNRYQRGRILVLSARARDLRVTGVFDAGRPAAAIEVIEATLPLEVVRLSDHLILLR
jgi:transmembrane sensor